MVFWKLSTKENLAYRFFIESSSSKTGRKRENITVDGDTEMLTTRNRRKADKNDLVMMQFRKQREMLDLKESNNKRIEHKVNKY